MNHDTSARSGVSRRTLLAGAAWSVPAVLVVGATPAFAVSEGLLLEVAASATRDNGAGVRTTITLRNSNSHDSMSIISISAITVVAYNDVNTNTVVFVDLPVTPFTVSPGTFALTVDQTLKSNANNPLSTAAYYFTVTYKTLNSSIERSVRFNVGSVSLDRNQTDTPTLTATNRTP